MFTSLKLRQRRFSLLALLIASAAVAAGVGVALRRTPLPLEDRIVGAWYGELQLKDEAGSSPVVGYAAVIEQMQRSTADWLVFCPDGRMLHGPQLDRESTWRIVDVHREASALTIQVESAEGGASVRRTFVFDGNDKFTDRIAGGRNKLVYLYTRVNK